MLLFNNDHDKISSPYLQIDAAIAALWYLFELKYYKARNVFSNVHICVVIKRAGSHEPD